MEDKWNGQGFIRVAALSVMAGEVKRLSADVIDRAERASSEPSKNERALYRFYGIGRFLFVLQR